MRGILCACATAAALWGITPIAGAMDIEWVHIGWPGNEGEISGRGEGSTGPPRVCGAVSYEYRIAKYEVTGGQYTEFLNAVAATDTYNLYDPTMAVRVRASQIERHGTDGSYTYTVVPDWTDRPVVQVSWGSAARFANWLHNGQPTGAQNLSTTEDGAYFLNGATTYEELIAVNREPDARFFLPTEDEWYKAAYYDGATDTYYDYPTASNAPPGYVADYATVPEPDPGNYATYDGDGNIDGIGPPYYHTEVGAHENSASPFGTFDQGGNTEEWVESRFYHPEYAAGRGIRGGGLQSVLDRLHAEVRWGIDPEHCSVLMGFRVAAAAAPVPTASGLGLTALACACGIFGIVICRRPH